MKSIPNPKSVMMAHVFEMTLYRVSANSDSSEGRGYEYTLGWFVDDDIAMKAAKGNYVMGTDCPIERKVVTIVRTEDGKMHLLGERVEFQYEDPREVKANALAKLTEKRKALGTKG